MRDYRKEIEADLGPQPPPLPPVVMDVPRPLRIALGCTGTLLLILACIASGYSPQGLGVAYRIGTILGYVAFWPAVVLGLFAISPRGRSPRTRAIVLLSVWGVCLMAVLAVINLHVRAREAAAQFMGDAPVSDRTGPLSTRRTTGSQAAPGAASPKPVASAPASSPLDDDFSPGSDTRLIKLIESSREDRYHVVVAAYERACAERRTNAVLALERVHFIERFANAEDATIKGADEDLDRSVEDLTSRFPDAPGTILYLLQREFGPNFDRKVTRYSLAVSSWPSKDRAQFFLLWAQRAKDSTRKADLARQSFNAQPSIGAGLLWLKQLPKDPPSPEMLRLFGHPVFRAAQAWEKRQLMDLLFDAGQNQQALALFRELKTESHGLVENAETATRLAAAGEIALARTAFPNHPPAAWNREYLLRQRFNFELKFGSPAQAMAAYRALRATGFASDPLLRDRVALLGRHPWEAWNFDDLLGLVTVGAAVVAMLLAPAIVLLPIHYWSLLRDRRAAARVWPEAKWGLRQAWLVLGMLGVVELLGLWIFQPDVMRTWWQKNAFNVTGTLSDAALLGQQGLVWIATALVLVVALAEAGAWRVLGRADWSWPRTIGMALAGTLVLRIFLLGYTAIWPHAVEGELASFSPVTKQLLLALLKTLGPGGLILSIAVLVPVLEELVFRGILLQAVARHIPFGWANLAQAALFASVHENSRVFPFFVVFGAVCGWLARRSGGLVAPILVHGLNNLTVAFLIMRGA